MFRLIGVNWPQNSGSFQIIIFALLWLESETEVPDLTWKYLLTIFYVESRVTIWLKKALDKLGNSLNLKVEKQIKWKRLKIE